MPPMCRPCRFDSGFLYLWIHCVLQSDNYQPISLEGIVAARITKVDKGDDGKFRTKFVYSDAVVEEIFHKSKRGMSQEQIGWSYGYLDEGFRKICKKYPLLKKAIVEGRAFGIDLAARILWEKVEEKKFEAVRFYLSTKCDYNPKQTVAIGTDKTTDAPLTLKIDTTDAVEAAKIYAKFMTER